MTPAESVATSRRWVLHGVLSGKSLGRKKLMKPPPARGSYTGTMGKETTVGAGSGRATRRLKAVTRKLRELGSIGSALLSTSHPYMAHIVPMRRCNLACTYCNEFDDHSDPVPIAEMERRIDELGPARHERHHHLGRRALAASRARPGDRAHPQDRRHRRHDHQRLPADAGPHRAAESRRARPHADLDRQRDARRGLQKEPEGAGRQAARCWPSMRTFMSTSTPSWAAACPTRRTRYTVSERALALGFSSTIGIIHDGSGQLKPLGERGTHGLGQACAS